MIETAEVLRPAFENSAVIARVGADRFGVISVDAPLASSLEKQFQSRLTIHNTRNAHRCRLFVATGSASLKAGKYLPAEDLMQLAETALCENKRGIPPNLALGKAFRRLNIALDATYSLGRNLSGVGVYCRRLLAGLAETHPESRFLYCYRPHRFPRSFREPLPSNAARRLLVPMLPPGGNLFHGLNQRVPPARVGRLVITFHDLFVMTGDYSSLEFRARFSEQAREAAMRADLIIAVSAFTASQVESLLGVEQSRIRVIPHGVDLPAPSRRRTAGRKPVVLHVGAIQKRKNGARLVRAFESLPREWHLVFAGSQGFGAEETLQAIATSPARDRIDLRGYVDQAGLERLYDEAAVFAFPSLDEGFGIPVLEAMAWGVPVLTSTRSSLPEVAGDAALLVDPLRTEEIAAGLLRLAGDSVLRESFVQRGLLRVREFSWKAAVERTWAVYRELADETAATSPRRR